MSLILRLLIGSGSSFQRDLHLKAEISHSKDEDNNSPPYLPQRKDQIMDIYGSKIGSFD